jgi:hypothetical protein
MTLPPVERENDLTIDVDDLEVKILILAKSIISMTKTRAFLNACGWPTTIVGSLTKVSEIIRVQKPDFLLISYSHPSPGIYKLPELMEKLGDVTCIGFVERGDNPSNDLLTNVKIRQKIFGPPSGTNLHRGIRRILTQRYPLVLEDLANSEIRSATDGFAVPSAIKPRISLKRIKELQDGPSSPPNPATLRLVPPVQSASSPVGAPPPMQSRVRSVGIFPLDSSSTPGYFIVPSNPLMDEQNGSLTQFQKTLQQTMSNAENANTVQAGFLLDVPEHSYASWASKGRSFQVRNPLNQALTKVAFFSVAEPLPLLRYIEPDKMCAVDLDQIPTSRPLGFGLYLHFKENQKYYLYLRKGRVLQEKQKERLKAYTVRDLFIQSSDILPLRKFWAAAKLDSVIPRAK